MERKARVGQSKSKKTETMRQHPLGGISEVSAGPAEIEVMQARRVEDYVVLQCRGEGLSRGTSGTDS